MKLRILTVAVLAASLTSLSLADEFMVSGVADGAFNGQASNQNNVIQGLTYRGSTFMGWTASGFLALGGNPSPTNNVNNFGSLALSGTPQTYAGDTFKLSLTFLAPTGIVGGNSTSFTANVIGQVIDTNTGGVNVSFGAGGIQAFTWANAQQTGTFTLHLNNVAMAPSQMSSITGYITGQAFNTVPEPTTIVGIGIATLAFFRRRKKA